jgi:hypothetical protein
MAKGDNPTSPWVFWQANDNSGRLISATVTFSGVWTGTNALTGGSVFRDPQCTYTKVIIGLGPDGTPDTSTRVVNVPAGTTAVTSGQLGAVGLHTVADVLGAPQITATA